MRRYLRFSVSVYAAMCPLAAMVSAATGNRGGVAIYAALTTALMNRGSVVRRRADLVTMGLVEPSGIPKPTRSGCAAMIWQITAYGQRVAMELRAGASAEVA